jgi:hypothetical protein
MPGTNRKIPDAVTRSLRLSGFPFQTAIRHEIGRHDKWKVHASEHAWRENPEQQEKFLDIVARRGRLVLAIECKKTGKETYTFLLPSDKPLRVRVSDFYGVQFQFFREQGRSNSNYATWLIQPESCSSEFCVVGSSSGGKGRLLENDAGLLVRAAEVFALDRQEHYKLPDQDLPRVVLPVIVTNAEIYTAHYDPTEVSLETGELKEGSEKLEQVSWIRFCKSFTADKLGERSVFVVNASAFGDFLEELEIE